MSIFEVLYDEQENVKIQFLGFITEDRRYDFGIVFSTLFFGKPIITCLQTGHSALLSAEDLDDELYIMKVFQIHSLSEAKDISAYLKPRVPTLYFNVQY